MAVESSKLRTYAHLILSQGVNLQSGQGLHVRAELVHRDFVHLLAEVAYAEFHARYVDVNWTDMQLNRIRIQQSPTDSLNYAPDFVTTVGMELLENKWAYLALVGGEDLDVYADVDADRLQTMQASLRAKQRPWRLGVMANQIAWCVAGVATPGWAAKVFPNDEPAAGVDKLWSAIFAATRADQEDAEKAWQEHLLRLQSVVDFLHRKVIRTLHFLDESPGPDGKPRTDLTIGMTDRPHWITGGSKTQRGISFSPNIPTEEAFSTPHSLRTQGYLRTSMPFTILEKQIDEAYVRFEDGEVVAFESDDGQDLLARFFDVEGTRRLGEVALVDTSSPIFQSGLLYYNTLYDENAACHVAFGSAYPDGAEGGADMSPEERIDFGINDSTMHQDVMIGTPTMTLTGICADGSQVTIIQQGRYTDAVLAGRKSG